VIDSTARIHPSADVEPNVSVGAGSAIGQRTQVRSGAVIGTESVVGRDVFIDENVSIGDRVRVHDQALVYHGVTIEDGVFVGPGAILTNDRFPRAITPIGELVGADDSELAPIILRRGCTIGAGAVLVAGVDVASFATVGAGAVVTKDVPGHALVAGNPARRIGWVCACGRRLRDSTGHDAPAAPERYAIDTDLVCESCGRHYGYVPDAETLEERVAAPPQTLPA
jgi:UDP-2-acetamido-3-amino-2,3-dideoxy-glucuronate N-acetyltransferase